jgi:type II pantothenate kinase
MSHDQTDHNEVDSAIAARPHTMTSTAEIDSTISHPGSVRINVKGAFIVDGSEQPTTPANGNTNGNGSYHEGKDIRLPNHTAVVSHIAVDVRVAPSL